MGESPSAITEPPTKKAKMATTISVAGWVTCSFYQKALAAANAMVEKGTFSAVEDINFPSKEPFKEWLASDSRPKFTDERADTHTSSPFVWTGDKFVGGCDDTLDLPRAIEYGSQIDQLVAEHQMLVFSKSWCPYCRETIMLFQDRNVANIKVVEVDYLGSENNQKIFMKALKERTGEHRVPQVFINHTYAGEFGDVCVEENNVNKHMLQPKVVEQITALGLVNGEPEGEFDYDLFVLGGGSGGCASSLEAARIAGLRVAVADFVKPAWGAYGTTWGVGGTCVNVGCIPKKLMHIGSSLGEGSAIDAPSFGWQAAAEAPAHNWTEMTANIHTYIKSMLNQGLLDGFEANGVTYHNAYGKLLDNHTIELTDADGNVVTKRAKYILLAAGGRPNHGNFPGHELCTSSDDLFWMKEAPGKTLVVGAAYIALECAGFLTGIGCDVMIHVRSILLRGFDKECVGKIGEFMESHGTKFAMGAGNQRFVVGKEKKVGCHYTIDGEEKYEEYDTVLLAIGRTGEATKLGLENAGIWFNQRNGKIEAPCERTNVPNIFCIGDLIENRLELTPVAKAAGKKVVKRLFKGENASSIGDKACMDYRSIATTVFTPLEYGTVGLSEEDAIDKYGADGFTSLTKVAKPLEWALSPARQNDANKGFIKMLVLNSNDKIIGFHFLGPNAGEVLQGMAVAIKAGATRQDVEDTVAIHPTTAETMCMLGGEAIKGVKCET